METEYDILVIGGGPAGATAAMFLAKLGVKSVLLIDKAKFPRDKICGDAQGRRASAIFKELGIYEEYAKLPGQGIYGITISSPSGAVVDLDVEDRKNPAPGFCHRRQVLDNFFYENASKVTEHKVFTVSDVIVEDGVMKGVKGTDENGKPAEIRAKLTLAADGAASVVAQKFGQNKNPSEHFCVATRQYYKGVTGMTDRIEIHMVKDLIPGYFWIFPMGNGEANIGLGMVSKDMQAKKVNLKEATLRAVKENPLFAPRFKNAAPLEDVKAWQLPFASHHRKCYGSGFLLLGDAASLIDPLSGEGYGNAMISGRYAAHVAVEALKLGDFSEKFLQKYDKLLWDEIGPDIKASYRLQTVAKMFPFLIDKLVEKAKKDEKFRHSIEKKLPNMSGKEEMGTSSFLDLLK